MEHTTLTPQLLPARFVGLDIGGSKTRGMVWTSGSVTGDATVGSTNVQNVSAAVAAENLAALFAALDCAGAVEVFVGAGGIDTDDDAAALRRLISPLVPGAQVTVVHDTRLLLAAAGYTEGTAVIAGTGSAAWGINAAGEQARAGGWGYLLGDEGSGYWLGREAVRHSLRRMDAGNAVDTLTSELLRHCELRVPGELIAHFHGGTSRRYWAAASAVVVAAADAGHAPARAMLDRAADSLAELAEAVAVQLQLSAPVVLGGGLGSNVPALQDAFTKALAERGMHQVHILRQDPILGIPLLVAGRGH
ncbi:N-acetylglucosamine kinase [Specibacter sp. NPDC057265]|uniref:N-acetylglucosamine kinase n=1 Tax=Specibacter sp. NPDC057265 TaxID=3346075 RepID=UPI0036294EFE